MASTIAPIAARPATSVWWTAVAGDPGRVVLKLSNDPRLMAGVSGAVEHMAERAGCDARACADLIVAAEEACRETFPLLPAADAQLAVTIEDFPDRVEVTFEYQGQTRPAAGLDTFAVPGAEEEGGLSGRKLLARVDRVQFDTQDATSRLTLVKYIRP